MSDLEMTRGNTAEWDSIVRHPSTKQPIDLAGATVRFMAKRSMDDLDADAIVDIDTTGGITVGAPTTDGKIHLKIPASDTDALENDRVELDYELRVIITGTSEWTVERGTLIVFPSVISA